jgi:hypothetical protein
MPHDLQRLVLPYPLTSHRAAIAEEGASRSPGVDLLLVTGTPGMGPLIYCGGSVCGPKGVPTAAD